ncbi:MAG: acetyl-CoA carboxylase biotin carboxyl carrier protein [Phycisphaerales bacterium]|nr:acetyl-CoA carboxylase biotin carboxyl carrier protein [Phycisphaerales bacterium]
MIDIRKLKELVRLMVENELTELDLKDKDEQVLVRRPTGGLPEVAHSAGASQPARDSVPTAGPVAAAVSRGAPSKSPAASAADDESGLVAIESPMVGTCYPTSGPDKPAFVTVGSIVGPDTVVCLLEAMKIFNEIKAEQSGTIVKVLVKSGQAVEFGQKLFLVRPS